MLIFQPYYILSGPNRTSYVSSSQALKEYWEDMGASSRNTKQSFGISAQKRIKKTVYQFTETMFVTAQYQAEKKKKIERLPTFATLTYPIAPEHDDYYLKRHHLGHFTTTLTRKTNVKHIVWKAEVQKSGNLHFHLILDCYTDHVLLRKMWNDVIEGDSYMTKFQNKHPHKIAPTTHIKALSRSRNAAAYICKYVAKQNEGRDILGRCWGCSDEVKGLRYPNSTDLEDAGYDASNEEDILTSLGNPDRLYIDADCLVSVNTYGGALRDIMPKKNPFHYDVYEQHYRKQYQLMY